MTGQPDAGAAGQPSEVEGELLRGLVDYLRQERPESPYHQLRLLIGSLCLRIRRVIRTQEREQVVLVGLRFGDGIRRARDIHGRGL